MNDVESIRTFLKSGETGLPSLLAALAGAMIWGAAHALTPGHGKTVVGAYLAGSRGTSVHAVLLGATVALTHTAGVFLLGFLALSASRRVPPDALMPWMTLFSALLVLFIGLWMTARLWKQSRHPHGDAARHGHGHDNAGHENEPRWRALFGLGVSGGLLPCPSALVVLLTAASYGRIGLGLLLTAAFGIGLAGVLTLVGWLFLTGGRRLTEASGAVRLARHIPVLSAGIITLLGLWASFRTISGMLP